MQKSAMKNGMPRKSEKDPADGDLDTDRKQSTLTDMDMKACRGQRARSRHEGDSAVASIPMRESTNPQGSLAPIIPNVYDFGTMAQTIKKGILSTSIDAIQSRLGVSRQELAQRVSIPKSTLDRRVRNKERLTPEESERLLRTIRLHIIAADTLGSDEKAKAWFNTPNAALGGVTPKSYADTEPGAREIENLLGRIQYGVYS